MNPGSKEAIEKGCTCPPYDNNHGKGGYKGTIVHAECPLHGGTDIKQARREEREKIVKWLRARCEENIRVNGTEKWNSDMEVLIQHLTQHYD